MPDKNLTDSEIVKALECCNIFMVKHCVDCPLFERNAISCEKRLGKLTLDLINRLQADVENYKQIAEHQQSVTLDRGFEIKRLKEEIESLQAENERLTEENKKLSRYEGEILKEFVERLKEKADELKQVYLDGKWTISQYDVDNLLKEMVGEDNV